MFCQKCQSEMQYTYLGHSQSTVELWACTNAGCDYTFEMRSNSRGFHFCFMQEEDLSYQQPLSGSNDQEFPHHIFEVGTGTQVFAGGQT